MLLARNLHWFQTELIKRMPAAPDRATVTRVAQEAAHASVFKPWASGLVAMTESAFDAHADGFLAHLVKTAAKAEDLDAHSSPNFKELGPESKVDLGELLRTKAHHGQPKLDVADASHAMQVDQALPLVSETIKSRYAAPAPDVNLTEWQAKAVASFVDVGLPLDQSKELVASLAADVEGWRGRAPQLTPKQRAGWREKFQSFVEAMKPTNLAYDLKRLMWHATRTPAEVTMAACAALSAVALAKMGLDVYHQATAFDAVVQVTKDVGGLLVGWLNADALSAVFHEGHDNRPSGRTGAEFQRHHDHPLEVANWPLTRNVDLTALGGAPLLGTAVMASSGAGLAVALTTSVGLIFAQQLHAYAHQRDLTKVPKFIQKMWQWNVVISPERHIRGHHGRPVGSQEYGIVNGWSAPLLDKTGFFHAYQNLRAKLSGRPVLWREVEAQRQAKAAAKKAAALNGAPTTVGVVGDVKAVVEPKLEAPAAESPANTNATTVSHIVDWR